MEEARATEEAWVSEVARATSALADAARALEETESGLSSARTRRRRAEKALAAVRARAAADAAARAAAQARKAEEERAAEEERRRREGQEGGEGPSGSTDPAASPMGGY